MANKRMFTKTVTSSDAFLEMPLSTQCLYFQLNMNADDDGFVGNPKSVMRMVGASEDDLKLLIMKNFLLGFDSGVIVIKHWRLHNTLSKDRYHETTYFEEKQYLRLKDNKAYSMTEGVALDDSKLIESGKRQKISSTLVDRRTIDAQKTDKSFYRTETEEKNENIFEESSKIKALDDRRTIDAQKTDSVKNSIEENSIDILISKDICQTVNNDTVRQCVELWNELSAYGITPVHKITASSTRARNLRCRIREYGMDSYKQAIDNIRKSEYLQGKKGDVGWFTFDWFVKPNNFPKVLDGNYSNSRGAGKKYEGMILD